MFGTLFGKECKQILKSLVYYIYILILVLFLSTQLGDSDWVTDSMKPEPDQESYGVKKSTDERDIMASALANLLEETERGAFATYPAGFYKRVDLTDAEILELQKIIESCTGKTWEMILEEDEAFFEQYDMSDQGDAITAFVSHRVEPREGLSYEEFKQEMKKVTKIAGKGSSYEVESMEQRASVPRTYEEALEDYEVMIREDKITGAYMRLFCDYAGIMLAFLPMFLGVTRCLRDKRADAAQVVWAKSASSAQIILSRYLANVVMAFLPVVVIGFLLQLPYCYHAATMKVAPDYLAFLKYTGVWLLPEIMIVMSLAFLLTEMTDKIVAVFVQIFWGFADEFTGITLVGDFGMKLALRWNTVGETTSYLEQRGELFLNRGIYAAASILLILLTVAVYEKKRKEGMSLYAKVFQNRR